VVVYGPQVRSAAHATLLEEAAAHAMRLEEGAGVFGNPLLLLSSDSLLRIADAGARMVSCKPPFPPNFTAQVPHADAPPAVMQIFSLLGLGTQTALWNSIVVGGAKILGVFIGVYRESF
jgi:hypothetical protein